MSKLRELEKRLRDEPDNLGLRVTVAGALREAGRQGEAVELYRSVAIAYRDQGRSQQAIAVCRSILDIAPDDQRCHALLAALLAHHEVRATRELDVPSDEIVLEAGTPPPPTATAQGSAVDQPVTRQVPTPLPRRTTVTRPLVSGVPVKRPSSDETPLPRPLPYHVADPTTRSLKKLSDIDLGGPAEPAGDHPQVQGIANAARRITAQLSGAHASMSSEDLASELATRRHRRLDSDELALVSRPPPTPDPDDDDDGIPTLSDEQEEVTLPRDHPLDVMLRAEAHGPMASPFFGALPEEHRGLVFARFRRKEVTPGTVVIRQGEVGHPLVLVERGQLEVRVERASGPLLQLAPIVSGEYVGEAALLARTPSPVQVVAVAACQLLLLSPRDFYEVAGAFPALWAELKDVAQRRTRELDARTKR